MKLFVAQVLIAVCVTGVQMNPISKVLEMIGDLQQKIIGEGEAAQKTYAEFAEWCEDESKNLRFEIKTAKAEVEQLKAAIEKSASDIQTEDSKVEELSASISTDEADLKAATEIRQKEKKDFEAEQKELVDTVDSLERAIMILERELKGGASLLQLNTASNLVQSLRVLVEATGISSQDKSTLTALIQSQQAARQDSEDDMGDTGAPDPAAYESKSGGIVDTLNDLLDKAESELAEARKKEKKLQFNYDMLKQQLTDSANFATKEMDKSKKRKAEAEEVKATAEGDLATTSKDLAEDITMLSGIHHDCMSKATDFEVETASRAEELKALATAKKIIQEAVGGALNQESFLQLSAKRATVHMRDSSSLRAVTVIKNLARKLGSSALAQLARRMYAMVQMNDRAGDDPFAKVKGLITEMVEKLMKEAEAEAAKHEYCEKEMGETKKKKAEMEDEIADMTAKIDQMLAEAKKLKEEVATLSAELADLAKSQAEMDKVREEEHAEFVKNKDEMDKGIEGIKLALKVLREYYAKKDKGHESADGAASGIIGLLEVAESDMSKGLEEMISAEEQAATEYEQTTKENEISKATKEQDVKYKSKESKGLSKAAAEATADREGVQEELDAVLEYFAKIKEECIAKPDPYEERKKRREAEIAGLKDALAILEGEAVLLQTKRESQRRHLRAH